MPATSAGHGAGQVIPSHRKRACSAEGPPRYLRSARKSSSSLNSFRLMECPPIALYPASLGLQMVAAVECRQQLRRVVRIAHHLVEIDHGVEFAAGANPGINGLTLEPHALG